MKYCNRICKTYCHLCRKLDGIHKKIDGTNKFNKLAGWRINVQESVVFLYINDESEIEIKNPNHLQ